MPMNKIDKARTVVMLTNEVRDVLLSNLNDMPEDWDGFEVRQAVLETVQGFISPIPNIARRRAFETAFFSGNFTRKKDRPDAKVSHCTGEFNEDVETTILAEGDEFMYESFPLDEEG